MRVYRALPGAEMNKGLVSVDEALATLLGQARAVPEIEDVPTLGATGRVLARAQRSTMDVPPMDNSAMDGYAVRASDLEKTDVLKVDQRIMAGSVGRPLAAGRAHRLFTGPSIPPGADAVVRHELCEGKGNSVRIKKKRQKGEWLR